MNPNVPFYKTVGCVLVINPLIAGGANALSAVATKTPLVKASLIGASQYLLSTGFNIFYKSKEATCNRYSFTSLSAGALIYSINEIASLTGIASSIPLPEAGILISVGALVDTSINLTLANYYSSSKQKENPPCQ